MRITNDYEYMIYKYTCNITNKSYIGQTKNLKERDNYHQRPSSGCTAFRNAVHKHGWDTFSREILVDNVSLKEANQLEELLISSHNTIVPFGYNIKSGGLNHIVHDDTKRKISKKLTGRKCSEETIEKRRKKMKGRKKPQKLVKQLAKSNTGKKRTQEQRKRMALAATGRHLSVETKQKISKANKGVLHPPQVCPICGKVGSGNAMRRWHFDKCKNRGEA